MTDLKFAYLDPLDFVGSDSLEFVRSFLSETRRTEIGWHYIIDLAWIYSQARHWKPASRVLDVGGGSGPTQFLLAEMGFHVTNVDLLHRTPRHWEASRYRTTLIKLDDYRDRAYVAHLLSQRPATSYSKGSIFQRSKSLANGYLAEKRHSSWRRRAGISGQVGTITLLQGDVCKMESLGTASHDAVVSLSSVEHIPADSLADALLQIRRVVDPEGAVAITTSASADGSTWYHAPSRGLCFSSKDICSIFGAEAHSQTQASVVLEHYKDCVWLKSALAKFYAKSGDNGMPWGRWAPAYIPVALWR